MVDNENVNYIYEEKGIMQYKIFQLKCIFRVSDKV